MRAALPDHLNTNVREALAEVTATLHDLYGQRLQHLALFGSQARGEASAESDVDVLVVLNGEVDYATEVRRMLDLKMNVLDRYGLVLSLKPVDVETYADDRHPLMMNVSREGAMLA